MERSGIDILEEILKRLDILEKKLNILDINIKTIANSTKIVELMNKAINTPFEDFTRTSKKEPGNFKFEPIDVPLKSTTPEKPKTIMVEGKMTVNSNGKQIPLIDLAVKVYDSKNALVKETKTNRSGVWVSHLPKGSYVALFEGKFQGKSLIPQNKNFIVPEELPKGQSKLEIR